MVAVLAPCNMEQAILKKLSTLFLPRSLFLSHLHPASLSLKRHPSLLLTPLTPSHFPCKTPIQWENTLAVELGMESSKSGDEEEEERNTKEK